MKDPRKLLAAQILFSAVIAIGVATAQSPTVGAPTSFQSATNPAPAAGSASTAMATPTATPTGTPIPSAPMSPEVVLALSKLATWGLVTCWVAFWVVVWLQGQKVADVLSNAAFFQVVTVMGVIAAAVVLSLCDKLKGELTVSILSGIVGYVLGSLTTKPAQSGGGGQGATGGAQQSGGQAGSQGAAGAGGGG